MNNIDIINKILCFLFMTFEKNKAMKKSSIILVFSLALASCVTVKPGEVGLKQKLGKLSNEIYTQGPVFLIHLLPKL